MPARPSLAGRSPAHAKTYDEAGDVVTELTYGGASTQTYSYDARGEMIRSVLPGFDTGAAGSAETRQYDADGRLVADVYYYAPGTTITIKNADGTFRMPIAGWVSGATAYYYGADGEVTATYDYARINPDWNAIWNGLDGTTMAEQKSLPAMLSASAAAGGADWGVLQLGSHVAHWGLQGQAGYDHEGNALAYSYSVLNQQTHAWTATGYTVSYLKQDGYLEASTAGTSTNTSLLPTADTSLYDAFGRRIAIDSHAQGQTTDGVRAFAYDANGQILERRDGCSAWR